MSELNSVIEHMKSENFIDPDENCTPCSELTIDTCIKFEDMIKKYKIYKADIRPFVEGRIAFKWKKDKDTILVTIEDKLLIYSSIIKQSANEPNCCGTIEFKEQNFSKINEQIFNRIRLLFPILTLALDHENGEEGS